MGMSVWQPLTDYWAKTTNWPLVGRFLRAMHNEKHYDVTYIPINAELEGEGSTVVPKQIVAEMIERSAHRVIVPLCLCRGACGCTEYDHGIGCIFLGAGTRDVDPKVGRPVTVEEALAHMDRAIGGGLIPQIGRVDADPLMCGVKDWDHFLTLCFCCTCCCVAMRNMPRWSPKVKERMHRLEGLDIEVTGECSGCGVCREACFADAVVMEGGAARITDDCKGCGICVDACPEKAIEITVSDGDRMMREIYRRIDSHADIVSG